MHSPLLDLDARGIRWIAFDAVGTLIDTDPPVARVYGAVARRHGSRLTDDQVRARFGPAFQQIEDEDFGGSGDWGLIDSLTTDEHRELRRWERIVSLVLDDVSDPRRCFSELFEWFGRPSAWKVFPDVAEPLRALAAAGYRLAVASNFDHRLHAVCDGLPELAPIEQRVVSSTVGYRKPSLHFYRALIAATGCPPDQLLMIGDDPINDVQGARRAGLHALHLDRRAMTEPTNALSSLQDLDRRLASSARRNG